MIQTDIGDNSNICVDDIGRIPLAPDSYLYDSDLDRSVGEIPECSGSEQLEIRGSFWNQGFQLAKRVQQFGQFLVVNGFAICTYALIDPFEMRAGIHPSGQPIDFHKAGNEASCRCLTVGAGYMH